MSAENRAIQINGGIWWKI